jgi:hypothetical protein
MGVQDMQADDFSRIARGYESVDGKWEPLAKGDLQSWDLLRRVCREYVKKRNDVKKAMKDVNSILQKIQVGHGR